MLCKALWSMRAPWARPCPGETGLSYLFSPPPYQLHTRDVLGQHQLGQKHTHNIYIHQTKDQCIMYAITCSVEICRNCHDRRSCKIFANCVNFPGKQRNFLHNMRRSTRFTHTKCDFALKLLKLYTIS